jgi:hypothetical protein
MVNFLLNYHVISRLIAILMKSVLTTILETIGPNFFSFTNGTLLLTENNFGTGLLNSF